MNLERQPFQGGVTYAVPDLPHVAIIGHYNSPLFEGDCTDWELKLDSASMFFQTRDKAEMALHWYLGF
jgi:hypothetical protein